MEAISDGRCRLVRFALKDDVWAKEAEGVVAMGACGGRLTVFIEPIVPQKSVIFDLTIIDWPVKVPIARCNDLG